MIKKYWSVFKECFFSTFSATLNKEGITIYQKKRIEKNIVISNAKSLIPISIIVLFAQVYFIISDLITHLYDKPFSYFNIIAEIGLICVSFMSLVSVVILFANKCEKVKAFKAITIIYYFFLTIFLSFYILSKLSRGDVITNIDSSIVYFTIILVVCPLYSRFLTFVLYLIMISMCLAYSFSLGDISWLVGNMLLLFMGIIISSYMCGRAIKIRINDEKLQELNAELSLKLDTDELTQVYNRRALKNYLEIKGIEWKESQISVAFIMLDIDFFKKYNDTYGHLKGDECLKRVAQATNLAIQSFGGNVYRYGGEEFLIIAPNCSQESSLQMAKEIHKSIAKLKIAHEALENEQILTVSLGVNVETEFISNSSSWILEADNQLYRAKHEGRNCTSFQNKKYRSK